MDYRAPRSIGFAFGLAARAIAIGGLTWFAAVLLLHTQLYATLAIVIALLLLIGFEFVRAVKRSADAPAGISSESSDSHAQHRRVEYLQTLLDTVAAALIIVDSNGGIRRLNRAAHSLLRGTATHLRDIAEFDAAAVHTLLSLVPGARQIVQFTDGRHLLCTAAQFSAPGYAPERLISLQRVAGELDAVEVKAWQDMARVIAHEMMNSLTPIASLSESLETQLRDRTSAGTSDVAKSIEAIRRRSLGLMSFIERYRRVADLPPPVIQPISAATLIDDIRKLVNAEVERHNIRLLTRVTPPDATFPADAALLEHSLLNLLQNALEATEHTSDAQVLLECTVEASQVTLTVSDNGLGLPEHERDRILLPFYSTKPEGSGIGLALVRQVALAHQGRLEIRSNEPRGAVVCIVLPVPPS
ncbi:sensor histidine kinase [Steroidobacter agaridevorans]|uniref:histidine kinase n=1 Tax=Steroidobacter agaridevorans TaxID=2695856 RepID=A0A829Y8N4_9GAMM|nr:ATP-binding protein [Steroidobacter agaridevorans]GFE79669.1 sensor histidine kinase [Steroidobacter agaridevorans]